MVRAGTLLAVVIAAGFLLLTGCASNEEIVNQSLIALKARQMKEPNQTYVVDPPDTLSIEFVSKEDRDMNRVATVRSDGCITLMLLEDVHVAGLTTIEIREKLERLYSKYFQDPKILVTVTGYNSKRILTVGELRNPGVVRYTGNQTVLDVLGSAGGFTTRAWLSRCKVIRGDPDHPVIFRVNLRELVYKGNMSQNIEMAEDDVLRIPPDPFAWVGYQLESLLFPFRSILSAFYTEQQFEAAGQKIAP